MKNNLRNILLMCIIFVMLCCVSVSASSIESELSSTSGIIKKFEAGKIVVSNIGYTRYSNLLSSGRSGVAITGLMHNGYVRDTEVKVILNVYDKDKNKIDQMTSTYKISKKSNMTYKEYIYADEKDYTIDDIKYYSLTTSVLSDVDILEKGENDSYYIENYHVSVNVNKNNIYNVEESFLATFKDKILPVTVGIPFRHNYVREDGSKVNKRAIISNIKVDNYYTLSTEKGIRELNIGKLDKANTKKNYLIKYDYNVGYDTLKGHDEFVYYLINNYNAKVDGVSFKITMPKKIDKEKIEFVDKNGILLDDVVYEVNGKVITGKINQVINPEGAYAIRMLLDDDYFVSESSNISSLAILSYVIPVLFITISVVVFVFVKKMNKNRKYNNSLYFNKNINSLEMGYLFNGHIKDNDIASLIFYLANKGYIKIEKGKKNYKLIKVKDYLENDRVEKIFMNELFASKGELTRGEVIKSLGNVKEKIELKLNEETRKNKIYINSIFNYKLIYLFMILIIFIVNTVNILVEYQPSVIFINVLISGIGYIILLKGVLGHNKVMEKMLYFLVALILIITPIVLTSYQAFLVDPFYLIAYIIGLISMFIIACIANMMSNRTRYGNRLLNKILAYKNYLINCDDNVLIKELKYNKNCFYDVLPYSFVLGISDKWIERFNDKDLREPEWYKANKFKLDEFYKDMKNVYSDIYMALKNSGSNK